MRYIVDKRYWLRGWHKLPCGLFDTVERTARFIDRRYYDLLMRCDAAHDLDVEAMPAREADFMRSMLDQGVIRAAGMLDYLSDKQRYRAYPARYREEVQWSITGACNFRCLHCFMSAPHAKHGVPTRGQLLDVVDQLAECGVFNVGITGGEPLMCPDFLDIVDALVARDIRVKTIYTNGWLVDDALLDALEERGAHPGFQLSFDGVGWHDFLRNMPGAEKRTIEVLKLLQERGYGVAASVCLHRDNAETLRETVNLLASLGVGSIKAGATMELGEWTDPGVASLRLSRDEELEVFERYIPQYFEDDAPLAIMLSGAFSYSPGEDRWRTHYEHACDEGREAATPACGVLGKAFYLGADGMVTPCMGMADCSFAANFPSLADRRLSEILRDSPLVDLAYATVRDVRDGNDKCRSCAFVGRCTGGCRNSALMAGDNYFGVSPETCHFFENGWDARIRAAAQPAFEEYLGRNPPKRNAGDGHADLGCP